MHRRVLKLTFILLLSFCVFSQTNAAINISPLKYELTVEAGTTRTETIRVTNLDDVAVTIYTSKEDFISGDDSGTPVFVPAGENTTPELSLTNWISLAEENITLAPRESREIRFTINVPPSGEPGGHYGAIFFTPESTGGQVSVIQRLGVLVLIDVPGEVKISGEFLGTELGENIENTFVARNDISTMPVVFTTTFSNGGNIHLKPLGTIEIFDENGVPIKNIGKEPILSAQGAFIGERMTDYIPINTEDGNVLPHSERKFISNWEGIAYQVIDETSGAKLIQFKSLTDHYATEIGNKAQELKFWEQIKTRQVNKKFTANIYAYYEGKDKEKKEHRENKDFFVKYNETYVGYNNVLVGGVVVIILGVVVYFFVIAPKGRKKREEELRKQIMKEMQSKNNK